MILNQEFIKGFVRLCNDGFNQGWHERNGGNLSYRIKEEEIAEINEYLVTTGEWFEIGGEVPNLANEYFLVTGSGKFFRNVILDPESNIGIIKISNDGKYYQIQWGLKNNAKPTSELPSHLMNHQIKKKVSNNTHRLIYHAHTTNIIALTFILPLDAEVFTRELWEMATECPVVFPDGVGVIDWMVPGGVSIAIATSELMNNYDAVIWAHHGLFVSGPDFDSTFGLMHTIEKSAEILIKVLSITPIKLQTITAENFKELASDFDVKLNKKFLYDKAY